MHQTVKSLVTVKMRSLMFIILSVIGEVLSLEEDSPVSINKPVTKFPERAEWMDVQTGSVRCYCNIPSCVTAGYMCKSEAGGCFSDLLDRPSSSGVYEPLHGCLEYLTDKQQRNASKNANSYNITQKKNGTTTSVLLCCHEDMCNHPITKNILNDTLLGSLFEDGEPESRPQSSDNIRFRQQDVGYDNSDVWFKAATIAVPICGAVILLVLIFMAMRILRNETMNSTHHKLGGVYMPTTQNKPNYDIKYGPCKTTENLIYKCPNIAPQQNFPMYTKQLADLHKESLLITENIEKSECHPKVNYFRCNEYIRVPINGAPIAHTYKPNINTKVSEKESDNNFYTNVNIASCSDTESTKNYLK